MNPDVRETEYLDASTPTVDVTTEASLVRADGTPLLPPASEGNEQLKQIWARVYTFLASLPEYLSEFFGEYKRPLTTLGLIFGGIVSVKLTLAILDAINDIPLLAPTFELIGIAYATWFIYRYLWKASSREELSQDFDSLKNQVMGGNQPQ